jgi:glucokinase
MEPKQYYIGIDVGGTSVKEGLFDEDGNLLAKASVPTPPIVDAAGFAAVTEAIDQVVAKAQIPRAFVAGIGLAVPCPIPASGDAKVKANIAINLPELRIAIQKHCPDAVVKYENDANAAAMGEAWLGSAKGVQNVVMVTIGTGVGGGVIVNGDVVSGVVGAGGEIGHMCLNPAEERTCGCGGHGHLEQYSSATGVVRCMKKLLDENPDADCVLRGKDFEAKDVFDAARSGDALAAREVDEMTDTLGMALASIASTTDPEMFLIGGGVARAGDVLFDPLVEHFKTYAFKSCRETPIKAASLGNDAGIYGAVRLIVGE